MKTDGTDPALYYMNSYSISELEGKLLTLVEATMSDVEQRKALKDIVRQTVWGWALNYDNPDAHGPFGKITRTRTN